MLIAAIIERLKDIDHELFRTDDGKCSKIAGAIDLQAVETGGGFHAPAAYVMHGLSRRVSSPDFVRPRQITWQRSVVVVVRAKASCKDDDLTHMWAINAVEAYERIIHCALSGWRPDKTHGPLVPVNTVPGRITGEYIEIAFTFDCQTTCDVSEKPSGDLGDKIKRLGLSVGPAEMLIDSCKEVTCDIQTNAGNAP